MKIDFIQNIKIELPADVKFALNTLHKNGYEGYIVGGSVRDSLLGKRPDDWDICTNASPQQVIEIFSQFSVILTGEKYGTVAVAIDDVPVEITTYRTDGEYVNNRSPESVDFTSSLKEDLSRRDFTINAMAYNHQEGLIDYFNGVEDLKKGIIRCVGYAYDRFSEDALRLLRAIRFATQLEFFIQPSNFVVIIELAQTIENISTERIREELNKILLSSLPSEGIELLYSTNLLNYIIPELLPCYDFDQRSMYHDKSVFDHTMCVLDSVPPRLELRLAALFHDIGKPSTFTLDFFGEGYFYGHHKESAKMTREIMERLKYSKKQIEYTAEVVYHHMIRYAVITERVARRFMNKVSFKQADDIFDLMIADRACSKSPFWFDDIYRLKFKCEKVVTEEQPLSIQDLVVNGYDLQEWGIPQGKRVGLILNAMLEEVLDDPSINEYSKLKKIAEEYMFEEIYAIISKYDVMHIQRYHQYEYDIEVKEICQIPFSTLSTQEVAESIYKVFHRFFGTVAPTQEETQSYYKMAAEIKAIM